MELSLAKRKRQAPGPGGPGGCPAEVRRLADLHERKLQLAGKTVLPAPLLLLPRSRCREPLTCAVACRSGGRSPDHAGTCRMHGRRADPREKPCNQKSEDNFH